MQPPGSMKINFIFFQGKGGGLLQAAAAKGALPLHEVRARLLRLGLLHFQPAAAFLTLSPIFITFHPAGRHHEKNTLISSLLCPRIDLLCAGTRRVLVHQSIQPGAIKGLEGAARPGPVHRPHLGKGGMFTRQVAPFHGNLVNSLSEFFVGDSAIIYASPANPKKFPA